MANNTNRKPARDVSETNLPTISGGGLDMHALLAEALTVPGQMSNCYNRFHRYSFLNMLLVFMQTGKMQPMATYKRWSALGRTVVKGSKALFVNHPRFVPDIDKATGQPKLDGNGKKIMKVVGFIPKATVFQLFQTDGPELTMPTLPDWSLDMAGQALDIHRVEFSHGDGNTQGYSQTVDGQHRYAINPVAAAPLKTAIHEFAHIVLGHTGDDNEYASHRGVQEFQAEAVALLVCKELNVEGYDDSASRAYIQNWLGMRALDYVNHDDEIGDAVVDVTDKAIVQIFSATDKILVAGRAEHYKKLTEQE